MSEMDELAKNVEGHETEQALICGLCDADEFFDGAKNTTHLAELAYAKGWRDQTIKDEDVWHCPACARGLDT